MQKIGSSTTTADENGEFTDGDPQREISCTWVMAAWLNTLQRELVHLCEEAGIPLDPADDTQVYKAISALLNDGVKGVVKSVNTHKPDTAGNVKLGTAADADVQTSVADLTVGHILTVGKSYGLGPSGVDRALLSLLRSTAGYTGFTWSQNTDPEAPPFFGASQSFGIQNQIWHQGSDKYALQTVWRDGKIGFRTVEANTVGPWCEYFHTKNPPTATQTGALPLTGGTMAGEIKSTSANILRGIQGGYGAILRMDANGLYFLQTNKDDPNGNYNANRSLTISNDTGAVGIGTQLTVTNADFINKVGYTTYKDGDGHDHYQVGGLRLEVDGTQMAEFYYNVLAGQSADISLHNKFGTTDSYLSFRNNGRLGITGTNPTIDLSSGTSLAADGNIFGSFWGNDYLSNWILNQIHNIGSLDVADNQWWAKINLNGGTLIVQGGYTEVRDAEVTDRIPLNIAVPNRLLHVSITNRNFAQGYATYNPQVATLSDDNTGFNFVHGQKERMIYWMAVGY